MTRDTSNLAGNIPAELIERTLTVRTPATTSNLGPGFDTIGLALSIYTTLSFVVLKEDLPNEEIKPLPLISVTGTTTSSLQLDDTNIVYSILCDVLHHKPEILRRVRIIIDSNIPLARGLGSSAAAIMGSLWAGRTLAGSSTDTDSLLSLGMKYEGHADQISPSLMGGLIVCGISHDGRRVVTQKLEWPKEWLTTVIVPSYPLSTHHARLILPKMVSRLDAVENVQRVSLLVAAIVNEDESAMREALHDKLHEPYRSPLVPELDSLRKLLKGSPALGCVLSGAGSSVLVVHHARHLKQIQSELGEWRKKQHSPPEILSLNVDHKGLTTDD